jgi:molybdopterin-binding protein
MKLSARNAIEGAVKSTKANPPTSVDALEFAPGVHAASLELKRTLSAYATVKASKVNL